MVNAVGNHDQLCARWRQRGTGSEPLRFFFFSLFGQREACATRRRSTLLTSDPRLCFCCLLKLSRTFNMSEASGNAGDVQDIDPCPEHWIMIDASPSQCGGMRRRMWILTIISLPSLLHITADRRGIFQAVFFVVQASPPSKG